jgi:hypothetical protein
MKKHQVIIGYYKCARTILTLNLIIDDIKKSFHFITTLDHNNYNSWEYKNSIEYNNLDACDLHEMVQC